MDGGKEGRKEIRKEEGRRERGKERRKKCRKEGRKERDRHSEGPLLIKYWLFDFVQKSSAIWNKAEKIKLR